jgi:nucleotide-binding universal stress UspA family protein
MRWIVGLDLRPLSHGALSFVRWLALHSRAADGEHFVGIHVLEEEHLRVVLRYHHLDEVVESARAAASRALEDAGASAQVGELQVLQGITADEALEKARADLSADAILVGRMGRREGHQLVRLGRVARHLIHNAASPVVVVPPDLELRDVGTGPIVALTRADEQSGPPCHFAARLAERLGRGLALLHVVPVPEDYGAHHLPAATAERMRRDLLDEGQEKLATWAASQGLRHASLAVRQGPVIETAGAFAAEQSSALLVAGNHHYGALERILAMGVGLELAASAARPVAVVPSPPPAR